MRELTARELLENCFPGSVAIINNQSERALCALYAIQDSIANNPVLREHPVIQEWGGTVPLVVLYAYMRRANQDSDPQFEANTTSFFRADQIQNALTLLGRDLGYDGLGFGIIVRDQPSTVDPNGNLVQVLQETDPERMIWLAHTGQQDRGHWRGTRPGTQPGADPEILVTTESRIMNIERYMGEAGVRWRDIREPELLRWAEAPAEEVRGQILRWARQRRGDQTTGHNETAASTLREDENPQDEIITTTPTSRRGVTSHTHPRTPATPSRSRHRRVRIDPNPQTPTRRSGRGDVSNLSTAERRRRQMRGPTLPFAADPGRMQSVRLWTGRSSGRQLLYPGSYNPARWTAAETIHGPRLVPYYFAHGPGGEEVRANLPDEYIYAQRIFILEQMPEGLDETVQGHIYMLLDTISHRIQLSTQPIWRIVNPQRNEGPHATRPVPPHPLYVVLLGMLTRANPPNRDAVQRAVTGWGMQDLLSPDLDLTVNDRGNLMLADQMVAEDAFPIEVLARRFIDNSGRLVRDEAFVTEHASGRTDRWLMPRTLGRQPNPDRQPRSRAPGAVIRDSFGDGYLRTDDIVAEIAMLRPYSRLIRSRPSMGFAARVGASTDADVLEYRRPDRGEPDLYRDRAIDEYAIARIVMRNPVAEEEGVLQDVGQEVMRVFVRVATNVQSRRGRIVHPDIRYQTLEFVHRHMINVGWMTLENVHLGHGNRERVNEYMEPVVMHGIMQMIGEPQTTNMSDLIREWMREASVEEINLRSRDGTVVQGRPRISEAERMQQLREVHDQLWEARGAGEPVQDVRQTETEETQPAETRFPGMLDPEEDLHDPNSPVQAMQRRIQARINRTRGGFEMPSHHLRPRPDLPQPDTLDPNQSADAERVQPTEPSSIPSFIPPRPNAATDTAPPAPPPNTPRARPNIPPRPQRTVTGGQQGTPDHTTHNPPNPGLPTPHPTDQRPRRNGQLPAGDSPRPDPNTPGLSNLTGNMNLENLSPDLPARTPTPILQDGSADNRSVRSEGAGSARSQLSGASTLYDVPQEDIPADEGMYDD